MNHISIVGRAGKDPEFKSFESGTCLAEFSVAVNGFKKDEPPTWFNIKLWGKQAQLATDYLRKGNLVGISGEMKTEEWIDKTTGDKRSKWVLNASSMHLLEPKKQQQAVEAPF